MRTVVLVCVLLVAACGDHQTTPDDGRADAASPASLASIKTVVVIYAENRGFDNVYGTFPGANGLPVNGTYVKQLDRDFSELA